VGTVVGVAGRVLRTIDGGNSWVDQSVSPPVTLNAVSFYDEQTGIVVGGIGIGPGTARWTTDGGSTWNLPSFGSFPGLFAVKMMNRTDAIAVGNSGTIRRTTDGGNSWHPVSGASRALYGLSFPESTTGYAVGSAGYLLRTIDGGTTWTEQLSRVGGNLRGVSFSSELIGTAVGDNGTILRTTTGGVFVGLRDADNRIPSVMTLAQNYPNPCNPSTTIVFSISASAHVSLKVFDLLGKEVATLANDQLVPGSHTRTFDASRLSSGVYFYRLQVGTSIQTRKLLLVK
jgi:hypothetical protein